MSSVIADALLALGVLVIAASSVGVAVLDDPLHRLHLVTPAALLGVPLVAAAVVVRDGFDAAGFAAIAIAVVSVAASPFLAQALARSIEIRRRAARRT
ncbi:hypothetical protein GHK86_08815 [Acidimicrobiaceae bacterium USS-CC1]|uniref:Monovalent cation/H(+) antiporter subunit G n=1 Tax=Acidiferrimicrobium australe TaxID=2664430 RepID=A0ABW9QT58_9ACTN|nr:hypothetical protein [Acidiferrimicrobium australe]